MEKWIHTIYSENRGFFKFGQAYWEGVKKNDFGRYFPIFIEIRGIVSYAMTERALAWFHSVKTP